MNALAQATSPYLLQHKDNPVNWVEWSEEAFARAAELNRPVFLSIGYSTCHWCHVMAHESFESEETAAIMNEHYVCIKVDREERPDIDSTYMTFVQATTGSGGWPLSVWLTPEALPIVGGTYFPPEDRGGRAGFPTILKEIAKAWEKDAEKMRERGAGIMKDLQEHAVSAASTLETGSKQVQEAFGKEALGYFDSEEAGYGEAPKFPRPAMLDGLLSHSDQAVRDTAIATLKAMAKGGIHDHLAGGFHRYSVDRYWHVPHYEKMLYDQGQLLLSYTEAYRQEADPLLKSAVYGISRYLLEEMRDAGGAFHAAEDADSLPTADSKMKKEGAFWLWSHHDLQEALDADSAKLVSAAYGMKAGGNARPESDPHGELEGGNTLFLAKTTAELAAEFETTEKSVTKSLAAAKVKLLAHRKKRPLPHRDDKVLTAWNALAIRGLARAGFFFNESAWITAAEEALVFLHENLWDGTDLFRTYRGGNSGIKAFPQDYAFLVAACLEMDGQVIDERWINWAQELQARLDSLFWSESPLGYVVTASLGETELLSMAEDYDGAEPSANNLTALNLQRLADRTLKMGYREKAERLVKGNQALAESPSAMPLRAIALREFEEGLTHVKWVGETDGTIMRRVAEKVPSLALLTRVSGEDEEVILCTAGVCHPTATDLPAVEKLLKKLEL